MMRRYAETDRCRWQFLLGYFGADSDARCGHCDRCQEGTAPDRPGTTQFQPGSHVRHPEFGDGTVMDVEQDQVTVLFEDAGYRTLDLRIVQEHGLLND